VNRRRNRADVGFDPANRDGKLLGGP